MTSPEDSACEPTVADLTPADAAEKLAALDRAMATLANAMIETGDARVFAVAKKCVEILRGLIAALKEQRPAWSLEWQADWIDSQLEAIASTMRDVISDIPGELASQFGPDFVDDHREVVDQRMQEFARTTIETCTEIIEAEMPEAMTYRREHHDISDEIDEVSDETASPTSRRLREKLGALHAGQLVMILVASIHRSCVLAAGAAIAWLAGIDRLVSIACSVAAFASVSFGVWSLWVWFGARRGLPPSTTT